MATSLAAIAAALALLSSGCGKSGSPDASSPEAPSAVQSPVAAQGESPAGGATGPSAEEPAGTSLPAEPRAASPAPAPSSRLPGFGDDSASPLRREGEYVPEAEAPAQDHGTEGPSDVPGELPKPQPAGSDDPLAAVLPDGRDPGLPRTQIAKPEARPEYPGPGSVREPQREFRRDTNALFGAVRPVSGTERPFNQAEIRWCLAERIRLEAAGANIDKTKGDAVDAFNRAARGYNASCGYYTYRHEDRVAAERDVNAWENEIRTEGRGFFRPR
ncbi:MAG: hypothetical protein MR009_02725 [Sutterellaceae bacterium]|nr:hypothetical protein [Sutterellaceae bacterium]MDD7442232.1 hypothetical protein [Sutterellaceae bacterium]MDY2868605.1 hypothetical protein [Mesosutterella sp.]